MRIRHGNNLIALGSIGLAAFVGAKLALNSGTKPERAKPAVVAIDWAIEAREPDSVVMVPTSPASESVAKLASASLPAVATLAAASPGSRSPAKSPVVPRDQALEMIAAKYSLTTAELRMVRYSESSGHAFVFKSHELPDASDRNDLLVRVEDSGVKLLAEYPHDPGAWTEFSANGEYGIVLSNKPRETSYLYSLSGSSAGKIEPFEFVLSYSDYVTQEPRFSPNGEYLAARTVSNGLIYLLETRTGAVRRLNDNNREHDRLLSVAFTPDSERVVATVGGQPGMVRIIHLKNAALSRDLLLPAGLTHPVFRSFTQRGRLLEIEQGNSQDRKPASDACEPEARIDLVAGKILSSACR